MFMYLKTKNFCLISLVFLISCVRVIEDPAKKYNTEFLQNNSNKISRQKRKHLALAKQQGIMYRDSGTDAVDASYYKTSNGTNLKKKYRNNLDNKKTDKKNAKYIDDELSIYYRQRTLKDDDFITIGNDENKFVFYLSENYPDYSKEKITFADIEPSREKLYGSIALRKEKEYKSIDPQNMQEDFDYLDIMNRVKKEMYLENKKQQQSQNKSSVKSGLNSLKDKFMGLFK